MIKKRMLLVIVFCLFFITLGCTTSQETIDKCNELKEKGYEIEMVYDSYDGIGIIDNYKCFVYLDGKAINVEKGENYNILKERCEGTTEIENLSNEKRLTKKVK